MREAITEMLRNAAGRIEIKNAEERRKVSPREAVLNSEGFRALWERIKHKTTYRVQFNNEDLLKECTEALNQAPTIPRPRMQWETADIQVEQSGIQGGLLKSGAPVSLRNGVVDLPDVLTELQDRTQLKRSSIGRILRDSGRLDDLKCQPAEIHRNGGGSHQPTEEACACGRHQIPAFGR